VFRGEGIAVVYGAAVTDAKVTRSNSLKFLIDDVGSNRVLVVQGAQAAWRAWGSPPSPLVALASAAIVSAVPIIVELFLLLVDSGQALRTPQAVAWLIALSGLDTITLLLGWRTWSLFSRAGPSIDDLLVTCTGRDQLAAWLAAALSVKRQIAWSVLVAAAALILLRLTQPAVEANLEMSLVSYVAVAWTGAIGGNSIYWLIALSEFGRQVLLRRDLNLVWHSPASTPAIAELSDTFGFLTMAGLVMFIALELLNYAASQYGASNVLSALSKLFPVGAGIAILSAGLMPHFWLYQTVREARRSTLRVLRSLTGDEPPDTPDSLARLQGSIELYRLVETSPGLPFSTASMVQYGAAVLGTILAFFLGS
jgi:hypothetical protein